MKHPLVSVVVAYAAGLLLGNFLQPPLLAMFAASFFFLTLLLVLINLKMGKHPPHPGHRICFSPTTLIRPAATFSHSRGRRTIPIGSADSADTEREKHSLRLKIGSHRMGQRFRGRILIREVLALKKLRPALLLLLIALAGWTNLAMHTRIISPNDLRAILSAEPELVVVRGKLPETPSQRVYERDETESWRTLARLDVTALKRGENWQPARGRIVVVTPDKLPATFFGGQEVEIAGVLAPPSAPMAEGLLDYRTYLRRQGIHYQLKCYSPDDWKLLSTKTTTPIADRFLAWSQATLARGLPAQDEPLKLLWAMTLGWRPALTDEVSAPFMQSGTMHVFAIVDYTLRV